MRDAAMLFLSLLIIAGFYIVSYLILTGNIHSTDPNVTMLIGTVFGAASSQAGNVVTYWFGTSKSSADKDKTIAANLAAKDSNSKGTTP